MVLIVEINILVFAVVFSLFALETGAALLNLIDYDQYGEKTTGYIRKSWAISGTFLVFYVVNFEATFPLLLTAAGTLYIVPVLAAGLLVIFRNAFIVYSESSPDTVTKKTYTKVYALSTLAAVFILLSTLSSTVTADGVNVGTLTVNYFSMIINPYNMIMFVCAAAVSLSAAIIFFDIEKPFGAGKLQVILPLILIILATFAYSTYTYTPFVWAGFTARWIYMVPSVLALLLILAVYLRGGALLLGEETFAWLALTVAGFETFGHPGIFGNTLDIDKFLPSASSITASLIITCATVLLLVVGLALILYANSKARRSGGGY